MITSSLEALLRSSMDQFPAQSALFAVDLTTGEPFAAIRQDTQVVAASTIKVPILCCALQDVRDGWLNLDQRVPISPDDFRDDTEVFEAGYRSDSCSLWELLYWMIVSSDNTATNTVISLLGFDRINSYCAGLGLKQTLAQRKMLDWDAVAAGRDNYTSPVDQYRLYSMLYHGEILTEDLRKVAFDFLSRCRSFDCLQRYLPDPVTVLHKPGGLDYLSHDAGIFLMKKRPYYLGVFTWDGPSPEEDNRQRQLIGRLARMVYDFVKREELS